MYRKSKPSKSAKREFARKMDEIREFCDDNCISYSNSMDSFYFTIGGQHYRVSNHSVESSNAGKTRIKDIYLDLKQGYSIDGTGNRK